VFDESLVSDVGNIMYRAWRARASHRGVGGRWGSRGADPSSGRADAATAAAAAGALPALTGDALLMMPPSDALTAALMAALTLITGTDASQRR
jgi:hypothetical protein